MPDPWAAQNWLMPHPLDLQRRANAPQLLEVGEGGGAWVHKQTEHPESLICWHESLFALILP